jgi:S-formylglutathione hydrolase
VKTAVSKFEGGILIDQGLSDNFLAAQLHPEKFEAAAKAAGQAVNVRRHVGYDHGYYFISTFIGEHIAHHARTLCA